MQWRCVKFQKDHSDGAGLSQKLGCQCKDTQKCSLTNHCRYATCRYAKLNKSPCVSDFILNIHDNGINFYHVTLSKRMNNLHKISNYSSNITVVVVYCRRSFKLSCSTENQKLASTEAGVKCSVRLLF